MGDLFVWITSFFFLIALIVIIVFQVNSLSIYIVFFILFHAWSGFCIKIRAFGGFLLVVLGVCYWSLLTLFYSNLTESLLLLGCFCFSDCSLFFFQFNSQLSLFPCSNM
uniref:Uncharacterized protein n=1 Tax=Rhizophora mucronata TaxID=61149 RepID=A0A2P2KTG0_RHIMU